ncbi:MAG: TIGR04086 family membrane protein [Clostridia bacterium]|nr:TIGR04086 family membrane protein [Clostridia bacterium]
MNSKLLKNNTITYLRGAIVAISVSLVLILLFALLIRFLGINDNLIMPINQVIKIFSIFFGVFLALKGNAQSGLVKGFVIGIIYTIIAYITFSLLSGSFKLSISLLYDIIFGGIIGAISGIISVNILKK